MKQTPRKPVTPSTIPPKNKGKWGTAAQMVQHPIPNLPTNPTLNRSFYGGMYCRHCTVIMLYMSTQSICLYCNNLILYWKPPTGARGRAQPTGKRRHPKWRPGTQALQEIRHYQCTTKLCIPKIRFIGIRLPYICRHCRHKSVCNVIDLIVRTVQSIQIKNTVHVFHVNTVNTILYGIYALNGTNVDTTTCIIYLLLSRLVKEITYRELRRVHAKCIMPPRYHQQSTKKEHMWRAL